MTFYLVDTNIVSRLAPAHRRSEHDDQLAAWIEECGEDLFLSVITVAEVRDGIEKARRLGHSRKAALLDEWWDAIEHYWHSHILPIDIRTAHEAGRLLDLARAAGIAPGFEDVAIAATASMNNLTVLTANEKHFRPLGVAVINPLKALPK